MRRTTLLSLTLLFAFVVPGASSIRAEEPMACVHHFVLTLGPGASTTPQDFSYTSGGQTGTIVCQGAMGERRVTGPGTIGVEGTIQGTCFEGKGTGTNHMTVPTAEGPMEIVEPFTLSYRGPAGTYEGEQMSGIFEFAPVQGDCVSTPLTKALIIAEDTLRG